MESILLIVRIDFFIVILILEYLSVYWANLSKLQANSKFDAVITCTKTRVKSVFDIHINKLDKQISILLHEESRVA